MKERILHNQMIYRKFWYADIDEILFLLGDNGIEVIVLVNSVECGISLKFKI